MSDVTTIMTDIWQLGFGFKPMNGQRCSLYYTRELVANFWNFSADNAKRLTEKWTLSID